MYDLCHWNPQVSQYQWLCSWWAWLMSLFSPRQTTLNEAGMLLSEWVPLSPCSNFKDLLPALEGHYKFSVYLSFKTRPHCPHKFHAPQKCITCVICALFASQNQLGILFGCVFTEAYLSHNSKPLPNPYSERLSGNENRNIVFNKVNNCFRFDFSFCDVTSNSQNPKNIIIT